MSKWRGGKSHKQDTRETTERDEKQALKAIIRKQRKEIQRLRRELSRAGHAQEALDEFLEDAEVDAPEEKKVEKCPECGKGTMQVIDLGIRRLIKCDTCGHRKTVK